MEMKQFNVLHWNFNTDSLEYYDVLPYFRKEYTDRVKRNKSKPNPHFKVPKTLEEFKEFVKSSSMSRFWGRCEHEMICHSWPPRKDGKEYKLCTHEQVMMNIDTIAEILYNENT